MVEDRFNPRELPFVYTNSFPDQLSKLAYSLLPPSSDVNLPDFWLYRSQESFQERFKDLGAVVWSRRNSYHLLFINGLHIFRMWTSDKYVRTEMNHAITNALANSITGIHHKKTVYYSSWVSIRNEAEVKTLMNTVRRTYGV